MSTTGSLTEMGGGVGKYITYVERCLMVSYSPDNQGLELDKIFLVLPLINGYDRLVDVMTNNYYGGL
jgi:hypothetical protein